MDLTLDGVGTRLGGRWVVDGIDATPPTGHLTGLLGPNGAGKTTLLRLVAGLLPPEKGAVLVRDVPVHELSRRTRARQIALLEQESTSTVPLTVREVVSLGRIPYRSLWGTDPDDAAVDRALVSAQADHLADRPWSSLSGGERQRVQIARALAQEPELLLLDEPTNHLDVSAQLSLLAFVRDLGTTTVAALHDLNLAAAFCEHVLVLADGHLAAAGHPREVLTPALLRAGLRRRGRHPRAPAHRTTGHRVPRADEVRHEGHRPVRRRRRRPLHPRPAAASSANAPRSP